MSEHRSAEEWRGPWKCEHVINTDPTIHILLHNREYIYDLFGDGLCTIPGCGGKLKPFERRAINQASEERIKELEASQDALRDALEKSKDALFHAWQGFSAICETDSSVDRRKMSNASYNAMQEAYAALAAAKKEKEG